MSPVRVTLEFLDQPREAPASGEWAELRELEPARFECRAFGSNPEARLTWSLRAAGRELNISEWAQQSGGLDLAQLELKAAARQLHLAELRCSARNEQLASEEPLIAQLKLIVLCE